MDTRETLGYLKGLMDGLDLDESNKETKMFNAIVTVLDSLLEDVDEIDDDLDTLEQQVTVIDEDLAAVEDFLSDDEEDDDEFGIDEDIIDEEGLYEVQCPSCGENFKVDGRTILDECSAECPACGELLEFELTGEEDEIDDEEE